MWSLKLFFLNTETISLPTPLNIYLLKVNDRNTRTRCEICLKLTIKTPERRQLHGVVLVSLLLTLSIFHNLF